MTEKIFVLTETLPNTHRHRPNYFIEEFHKRGILVGVHHIGDEPFVLLSTKKLTENVTKGMFDISDLVPRDSILFYSPSSGNLSLPSFFFKDFVKSRIGRQPVIVDLRDFWFYAKVPLNDLPIHRRRFAELIELCKEADVVITVSPQLQAIYEKLCGREVHLIPNGTSLTDIPFNIDPPDDINPYIVVFGWMNPFYLWIDLLKELSKKFVNHLFYIYTPTAIPLYYRYRIFTMSEYNNLHLHCEISPYILFTYVRRALFVLCPYRFNPSSLIGDSIRCYDALAMNLPVLLINNLSHLTNPGVVRLVEDDFEKVFHWVSYYINNPPPKPFRDEEKWRRWVNENSWERRVDQCLSLLNTK